MPRPPVASPARAAEVISSNTVGYQKLTVPAGGYALLANPFTIVGSDGDRFKINDMFTNDGDVANAGRTYTQADKVQTFDPAGQKYTTYFFSSRINGSQKGWALSSAPTKESTVEFDDGAGYWYYNYGDSPITLNVAGEVATNKVTVTLVPGFTLVCNPFPSDLSLNDDIDWETAGANAGRTYTQADKLQTFNVDEQKYTTYFFSSRINGSQKGWALSSAPTKATTDPVPAGGGFWYFNYGSENITITLRSPLSAGE